MRNRISRSQKQPKHPQTAEICWLSEQICRRDLLGPGPSGNISVLDRDDASLYSTWRGVPFSEMSPENIASVAWPIVREDDEFLKSHGLTSEWRLHRAVYDGVGARIVAHVHSPWVVAASCMRLAYLPFIHYYQAYLGEAVTPFVPFAAPGSQELADEVLSLVRTQPINAVVLANHGAVTWANSVVRALMQLQVLEELSRLVVTVPNPHEIPDVPVVWKELRNALSVLWTS